VSYESTELNRFEIFIALYLINTTNFEITEQYITEVANTDRFILYSDALNSCTFLCKKKTGYSSQQSMRNYIATLISEVAPFTIVRNDEKRKLILK